MLKSLRMAIPYALLLCLWAPCARAQSEEQVQMSRRGKEMMAAGRFAEAAEIYRQLVRVIPNNPGLLLNLGMALQMAGEDQQALSPLAAALKLQPSLAPAALFLGTAYYRLGEAARAVAPLETAVRSEPQNAGARGMLADALLSLERYAEAARHFEKLSQLAPDNPRVWYGLGRSYEALSARAFAELGKLAPESAWQLALLAESRVAQHQFSSAFFLYRRALEKQPAMRGIHAALAEVYRQTGHADWAEIEAAKEKPGAGGDCAGPRSLESGSPAGAAGKTPSTRRLECLYESERYGELVALAKTMRDPESDYWRSRAYNQLAVQAFSRLAQLPPSVEVHSLMAEIHRNSRRYLEAVKEWRGALALAPGDARLERELGISLREAGDHSAALPLLEKLLKREPNLPEFNFLFGDTLLSLQKAEEAIPLLEKAVQLDEKLLPAQASLARALLQTGQADQAIPHLKAALPTDTDGSLHYQLARAYQATGHAELAEPLLKEYQRIRQQQQADTQAAQEQFRITPP